MMDILLNPLGANWVYPDQDFNKQLSSIMKDLIFYGAAETEITPPKHWNVATFDTFLELP